MNVPKKHMEVYAMKKILCAAVVAAMLLTMATGALAATGLGSVTTVSLTPATADKAGSVSVNTTMCAVSLDDEGKIVSVSFDVVQPKAAFDATGAASGELNAAPQTKVELGDAYGMKPATTVGKEWYEQAAAFADWCVGKTVDEVLGMPTRDKGDGHHTCVPDDVDLKTSCTIDVGGFFEALTKAAANAK